MAEFLPIYEVTESEREEIAAPLREAIAALVNGRDRRGLYFAIKAVAKLDKILPMGTVEE